MFRRSLLAAALAAPALALVPAAPTSAGCTEEYADDMTTTRAYAFVGPNTGDWASADPATLTVTVNGGLIVGDATYLASIPVIVATTEARDAVADTVTYVKCV